jgi:hypothetical protein
MTFTYRVLCFGHNLMLLETRQWILEKRFLSVYVSSLSDLKRVAEGGGFDLLILCHSVLRHDFRKAADLVHDICPRLKLLAAGVQGSRDRRSRRTTVGARSTVD